MKLNGIVLAGGKSSRFGKDKALHLWEGKTLLERAVRLLSAMGVEPAVIANENRDYSFLPCPVHQDLVPDKGPLGGLFTAWSIFPHSALLVLTCDMPFLTPDVLRPLMREAEKSNRAAVYRADGILAPFPGVYPASLRELSSECFDSEDLSLQKFLSLIPDLRVLPKPADIKSFRNVNRPSDLEKDVAPPA